MGMKSRRKGKTFERKIARALRERWPEATVRRSSQAERAFNADVFVEGGPPLLSQLWLELHDARNPNVRAKLEQAERDIEGLGGGRRAIVIWHRLGERSIQASMRLSTLRLLAYAERDYAPEIMTMDLGSFVRIVERAIGASS